MCPHCAGRIDTKTAVEPAVAVVVEPGPRTMDHARAVRAVLARILRLVFEVIAGRRPVVQPWASAAARWRPTGCRMIVTGLAYVVGLAPDDPHRALLKDRPGAAP